MGGSGEGSWEVESFARRKTLKPRTRGGGVAQAADADSVACDGGARDGIDVPVDADDRRDWDVDGGPRALQEILPMFPEDLPVPVLVVQHMPVGFTGPFAKRLDNLCKVAVREATAEETIEPGKVYIAPAGWQMTVGRRSLSKVEIHLAKAPSDTPHIPSVDVMMHSVAAVYRGLALGVIMTGMGADGAMGMDAIRSAGGLTFGQDEASCTVYGMPWACAEMGILRRVMPLEQISAQVLQVVGWRGKALGSRR